MEKDLGRIDVLKDTMLFVTNELFGENIKKQTTKEKILDMLPEIYGKANPIDIIKMLPYDSYIMLEKIIKYVKENQITKEIIESKEEKYEYCYADLKYLYDAMILVMRTKQYNRRYFIDNKVLNVLEKIYTEENRKLAEKYGRIEKVIIGILNTYGVIEENEYKRLINLALGTNIKKSVLEELEWKKLNLNTNVNLQTIAWKGGKKERYKTKWDLEYDEKIIIDTIKEQKSRNLDYKEYSAEEYIDKAHKKLTKVDIDFIKELEKYKKVDEYYFRGMKERIETGEKKVFQKYIQKLIDYFELEFENANDFLQYYVIWYNSTPQFVLCGYSPKELSEKYYGNRIIE